MKANVLNCAKRYEFVMEIEGLEAVLEAELREGVWTVVVPVTDKNLRFACAATPKCESILKVFYGPGRVESTTLSLTLKPKVIKSLGFDRRSDSVAMLSIEFEALATSVEEK